MSVRDQMDGLADDISASYDAVVEMGGTVPEEGGSVNLPEAIRSIPKGGDISDMIQTSATTADNSLIFSAAREPKIIVAWASTALSSETNVISVIIYVNGKVYGLVKDISEKLQIGSFQPPLITVEYADGTCSIKVVSAFHLNTGRHTVFYT